MADFVPPLPSVSPSACAEALPQHTVAVRRTCVEQIAALVLSSQEYTDTWAHFFHRPIPRAEDLSAERSEQIWSEIRELAAKIRQALSSKKAARISDQKLESQPELVLQMLTRQNHRSLLQIGYALGYNPSFPRDWPLERKCQSLLSLMVASPRSLIRCVSPLSGILSFPRTILSPSLTQLVVIGQGIRVFPFLDLCTSLQHLQVAYNELSCLPPGIQELRNLRTLDLSGNRLEEVSFQTGCSPALESLILQGNRLLRFPDIVGCTALTKLDVSENAIHEIPEWIEYLQGLQEVQANRCGLEQLPKGMGLLSNLRIVGLACNRLRSLPPRLHWPLVQTVDLSLNEFREVSAEVGQLPLLDRLDLSYNMHLLELPPFFSRTLRTLVVDITQRELLEEDLVALTDAMASLTIEVFGVEESTKVSV
jgi:Leucine-rich repeat (LRR) protein